MIEEARNLLAYKKLVGAQKKIFQSEGVENLIALNLETEIDLISIYCASDGSLRISKISSMEKSLDIGIGKIRYDSIAIPPEGGVVDGIFIIELNDYPVGLMLKFDENNLSIYNFGDDLFVNFGVVDVISGEVTKILSIL